jgi:transcriptional regulator with XRE-family HTH domain
VTIRQSFSLRLRWWRERRGLSQLELANSAEVSQRHISFIELGRTVPSREMVLRLAVALAVPFREQNGLLLATGYAPVWREQSLSAPEFSMVNRALDFILAQQEPFPAFVVDRRWNLLRANVAGSRFVGFLTDSPPLAVDPARPIKDDPCGRERDALDIALDLVRGGRHQAMGQRRLSKVLRGSAKGHIQVVVVRVHRRTPARQVRQDRDALILQRKPPTLRVVAGGGERGVANKFALEVGARLGNRRVVVGPCAPRGIVVAATRRL